MYFKLALNNIKKSYKDYLIYFLTITFGICLFYLFNSLESQKAMMVLDPLKAVALTMLNKSLSYVSFFMTVVLAFLMVYANQFLIKRRKKEIGIYMTLGMERRKISFILVLETLIIGFISLFAGLILGILGSHFLSIITAKMFEVEMKEFQFIFSKVAFNKAIINFSVIYGLMMILNIFNITKVKLIDLLLASKKQQDLKIKGKFISILIFMVSLITLGVSYAFIIKNGMMSFDKYFKWSIVLGLIGTLLFFMSLSGILMDIFQSNKKFYLRNLNMFSLRQISSKVNSTYIMISILTILLLIAFGTFSTGMGIVSVVENNQSKSLPMAMTLSQWVDSDSVPLDNKINMDEIGDYVKMLIYPSDIQLNELSKHTELLDETQADLIKNYSIEVMAESTYNAYAKMMKLDLIELNHEYVMITNMEEMMNIYKKGLSDITFNNEVLSPKNMLNMSLQNEFMAANPGLIILPDELVEPLEPSLELYNFKTLNHSIDDVNRMLKPHRINSYFLILIKDEIVAQNLGLRTIIAYVAIYIGLVFIMSCVVSLALQQLTEASDNIERYQLLRKLGVENKMIKHSLLVQISVYFFMPLSLAIVHSIVGIKVSSSVVNILGRIDILSNMLVTSLFAMLIYGSYFIITYVASSSIVLKNR
ncbi:MAG: ABC transporter permease [Clostridia bacterium]|nr:ABC transporter permease [Clostridia bacterium]